jgi:hypothetical protein
MENNQHNPSNPEEEYTSSKDPSAKNTENHEEEGGKDYSGNIQGGQGGKSTDGDENTTHDQGKEESNAGREDS